MLISGLKKLFTISVFIICTIPLVNGQKVSPPTDLNEAISILNLDCPDSLKNIIKQTSNDSLITLLYPWGGDYKTIFEWTKNGKRKSRIERYLTKLGVAHAQHQNMVVLIAFKSYLLNNEIDERAIIDPFQKKEAKWAAEDKIRFTTDSLRGIYIPKDLEDCFETLNMILNQDDINAIKSLQNRSETILYHHGLGTWLRNNWGLWGGSRLQSYFIAKGIKHPDSMSATILEYYYDWLNENNDDWMKFDKRF